MNPHSTDASRDFAAVLRLALNAVPGKQLLARRFLEDGGGTKRYVVGRNEQAIDILRAIRLDGVIDDYEKNMDHWQGVPIVRMAAVPSGALVVNCSTSISPVSVGRALDEAGISNVLGIHELIYASRGRLPWPWFVEQQREDLDKHLGAWGELYQSLADAESRSTLLDVVRFRSTADPAFMQRYHVRFRDQYFEDFLQLGAEVFVDAGGFDGDTTEEFVRRYPDYRKVYLFEPSQTNIEAARQRLAGVRAIEFHDLGLSDQYGVLSFNPDAGSASAVMVGGVETIPVATLDEVVDEPVTFIKMDLEGWELKALAGCAVHIRRDKPKLALSVYHAARDFRVIFDYVLSLNPAYKVYLRHYTQGWSETVMYFV